jgi:hypothetical protein
MLAGMLAPAGFLGYLTVATIFSESRTVRLITIGPYGVSAAIWLALSLSILGRLARCGLRHRDR